MPRNSDSGMSTKKQCICLLQIENFPSRYEIYKSLEKFLAERHLTAEYEAINKDNTIQLIFKDSVLYFCFIIIFSNRLFPLNFRKVFKLKRLLFRFMIRSKQKYQLILKIINH